MTSRLNQRAISILAGLAIILLLLLIIFLWTGVQNGLFSKSHHSSGSAHKLTGKTSVISSISKTISGNIMTPSYSISHKTSVDNNDMMVSKNLESSGKKIFIPPTNIDSAKDTEIVKPIKMSPLPLHEQDLIYEQSKYGDRGGEIKLDSKYHSGHFRYKNASIWDPHPEYEIRAFGKSLHLKLSQDSNFVASDIKFSQMVNSELSNITTDYKSEGCFYTGIVEGDPFSSVAVSLCHGMTGYIRTENETYLIEPTENFKKDATTILHAMHRQKFNKEHNMDPNDNLVDLPTSNCGTTSDSSPNYDDNSRQKRSIRSQYNWYDRRKLLSMRYAKEYIDDDQYSTFYPNDEYNYQYGDRSGNNIVHYDDKYAYTDNNNRDWTMNNQPVYSAYTEERRWKRQDGTTMTENQDYVVEVLIIVDGSLKSKKLLKGDLHHYILTLMSHVALLFKNDTLGNSIRISVVGIIDLDDFDIMKTSNNRNLNSTEMLKVFCEWQKYSEYTKNYRKNRSYNVAVLLTRSKLCRTPSDCNVLGVANESTMCKKDSCAIVKETGLGTSFTIAHEIGHVLGMPHDGSRSCQQIHKNKLILGAMAHQMTEISNPWLWSPCAKFHLSEFIDSAKSKCLLKTPSAVDMITEKDENGRIRLPGVDITPEEQCKLIDPDSTLCPAMQDTCDTLWCKSPHTQQYNECRLFHHTVADGTLCNKTLANPGICLQGKCVNPNNIKSIAGGWGPYGDWGECSMSCGGGIKKRRRECNNPRPYFGQYCRGVAVEYTTCNTHACVINPNHPYADARETQCSSYNGNNFNIPSVPHNVRWLPKYGLENKNKCVLYCRVENRKDYYKFAEKVKDGTKCDLNQYDICVNGICKKGGCDHALGSDLILDMCGNCGGDNTTCHEINNTANEILYKNHDGYIDIITIPQGSYNIKIWKKNIKSKDGSYFYLALKNESGGYIFNGNYRIQKNETSQFYGGLQFVYTGSKLNEEKITSNQKFALTKPLVVQVLKSGSLSTTVHYSYMVNRIPEYTWTYGNWTECTEECDGHKYQHAICVQDSSHRQVPPEYCSHKPKPESYATPCNIRCKFRWERADYTTECSKPCEGERQIFYHCVLIDYNQSKKVVHDNHCMDLNKPPRFEKCGGQCEAPIIPQWTTGNWSACSTTCDMGQQLRTVVCTDQYLRPISSSLCKMSKPSDIQLCKIDSCPKWIERNHWEPCSTTCGKGTQTRYFECQREAIRIPDHFCNSERPQLKKECYSYSHCYGNWTHSAWGECDQNCYRIRHLNCVNLKNGDILDTSKCDERHKPPHAERCHQCSGSKQVKKNRRIAACHWKDMGCPKSCDELNKRRFMCVNKYTNKKCRDVRYCGTKKLFSQCPPILHCPKTKYRWVIEKWGQCINGIQKRKMHCENEYGKKIRRNLCPAIKPRRKQKCAKIYKRCRDLQTKSNKHDDGEYLLTVRGKQVRIYCDGMNTNRPVEYLTLMSDFNYARFNNTQSENPSLDCGAPQRARPLKNHLGHTNFARIRLHLATLKVQIDDFKYATHYGDPNMKMRYGTAGDCYSLNNCPQGIFSIYLENTDFQVSPKTKWKGIEPKSSVQVDYRDPRNIRGKCGGYCGSCEPEEPNGLMLEVT